MAEAVAEKDVYMKEGESSKSSPPFAEVFLCTPMLFIFFGFCHFHGADF